MPDECTKPLPQLGFGKDRPELTSTRLEEHLRNAVHCLVGDGPMRVRLGLAMNSLARLLPADIPEALRPRFDGILRQLKECAEKDVNHRIRYVNMRKPRSGRIASEIFDLYIKLWGGL